MSLRAVAIAASLAVACASCGGPPRPPPTAGCVARGRTRSSLDLVAGQSVTVAQPCPEHAQLRILEPIRLTATDDGLRVQISVANAAFTSGSLRDPGARDVVVVFPSGEGPGQPSVELAVEERQGGYRVDDVLPWETWGFHGADGSFHFVCVLFDRDARGNETEVHVAMHVRVRPAPPQ